MQYTDKPMADKAIAHFNGAVIAGMQLTVQVAPVYTAMAPSTLSPPPPNVFPAPVPGAVPPVAGTPGAPQAPVPPGGGEVSIG